jgi:predicted regulator of Ras-like GTPase activity (Roadblock/LC7/MglB family)
MNDYDAVVGEIERQPGVLTAMLVGAEDGMVIAGSVGPDARWDPAAALASSVFRRTRDASTQAGLGEASFVRLEADRGHVCATARGDFVLVAVTTPHINLGRLRLQMLTAMEQI